MIILTKIWEVTTLSALKNLESMSLEKLVGTLKVHEQELQQNEGPKREKSLALNSQKNKKVLSSKEHISRNSFKALKFDNSSNEESEENSDKDELPFISWKIRKMWKNKGGSKWKNSWKWVLKEKIEKDKKLYNMLWLQESPTLQIWVYRTKKGSRQEETLQDQREERSYKHQGRSGWHLIGWRRRKNQSMPNGRYNLWRIWIR